MLVGCREKDWLVNFKQIIKVIKKMKKNFRIALKVDVSIDLLVIILAIFIILLVLLVISKIIRILIENRWDKILDVYFTKNYLMINVMDLVCLVISCEVVVNWEPCGVVFLIY